MRASPLLLLLKTFILVAVTASGPALADDYDPPAQVGRISIAQGQVAVRNDGNEEAGAALVNWPVTGGTRISTGRGALAEFRVGSAALRVAGDSELEVTQLDDDNFRLRLNYGSAGVRIDKRDMARGFELLTDQARVTLVQPGWLRVDAGRELSVVSVFSGMAEVDGGGSLLRVEAGKRAAMRADEMRVGVLRRDDFDNWPQPATVPSLRYVTDDITGYDELDRYGNWRTDPEYGPLWLPHSVPADWAPYRDGRWIWLNPWGWTWVDNAPWGYAPSHYGRWVLVQRRWAWAPGSFRSRPAWAPALVGWVGGPQWQVEFGARSGNRTAPGVGWFPLSPRERYVPPYQVSAEHERRLDWRNQRGGAWRQSPHRDGREGLTVVPGEQFRARGMVPVNTAPKAILSAGMLSNLEVAPAPARQLPRTGEARPPERSQYRPQPPHRAGQEHMGQPAPGAAAMAPPPQDKPADQTMRPMRQAAPPAAADQPPRAGEAMRPERNQSWPRQPARPEPAPSVPSGAVPVAAPAVRSATTPIAQTPAPRLAAPPAPAPAPAAPPPAALPGPAEATVSGPNAEPRHGQRRMPQPNFSGARESVSAGPGKPAEPEPVRRARETAPPPAIRAAQQGTPAPAAVAPASVAPASAAPTPHPPNASQAPRQLIEHRQAERERKEAPGNGPAKREEGARRGQQEPAPGPGASRPAR